MAAPLQPPACPEEDDVLQSHVPAPPTCHPGVVGPLASLGVVVTLAEALVECLVSGAHRLLPETEHACAAPTRHGFRVRSCFLWSSLFYVQWLRLCLQGRGSATETLGNCLVVAGMIPEIRSSCARIFKRWLTPAPWRSTFSAVCLSSLSHFPRVVALQVYLSLIHI